MPHKQGNWINFKLFENESENENENANVKLLTCNQKPTGSQFSLLHKPN